MTTDKEVVTVVPVVSVKGLSYSPGDFEILKNIDLSVCSGEFVGLIGPNGAGKTTLLKCLNGICRASGDISINGARLSELSSKKVARSISLLHQNTVVTFPFPALDVVLMGRYPHGGVIGWETAKDIAIARHYMTLVDAAHLEARPVTELSGGETQRVMLARVLAQEADIILLDEPTASLDIAHEETIFKFASDLCGSGKTVIVAVHDLKIAAKFCSRLILLKDGAVYADGSPEDVLTTQNISAVYGVNALVYRNRISGRLDFFLPNSSRGPNQEERVHVIGGGGSASGVIRFLFENGYKVSAGVFAHGDSDILACETFNVSHIACEPFSEIREGYFQENIGLIKASDFTVLCDMPFGTQNLRNLEAAAYARKLVIIEDESPAGRDFTGGRAMELYEELKKKAIVIPSVSLHEIF